MPKVVDHAQRRREIADALWAVIRREGLAAASVRTVAAESGWSTGAIRHYFASQAELLSFAMTTLQERARERITAVGRQVHDLDSLVEFVAQALPLDAERHAEAEVWLALTAAARTDPALRAVAQDAHRALRDMCRSAVLFVAEGATVVLDVVMETDRLHALVDGLAVHGTLYPRLMPRTRMRAAVHAHLHTLCGGSTEGVTP